MGRVNVGGGGKQVECKFAGYAYSGKTSPLGANAFSILENDTAIGIRDGYLYANNRDDNRGYIRKYKINTDNTLTLVQEYTEYVALVKTFNIKSAGLDDTGIVIAYKNGLNYYWTKISLATFEKIDEGKLRTYGSDRAPRGRLFYTEGEYYFIYVDGGHPGIIKDSYGNSLNNTPTTSTISYKSISSTANQSFRAPGNYIGVLHSSPNVFRLMTKDGLIAGYALFDTEYYNFSDENFVYSNSNKVYEPLYSINKNTNSIANPKRKNLSAKFDVLPEVLR